MRGKEVFYPIGWDDNGLPTERRVQNYYHVRCDPSLPYDPAFVPPASPGAEPAAVSRRNFVELCHTLTGLDEQAFEAVWRRLGLSVDWSASYQTIGDLSRAISQRAFLRNLARGEAYLAEAPTLWDVSFQTAIAQAEVEDRDFAGAYYRIAFHRVGGSDQPGGDRGPADGRRPGIGGSEEPGGSGRPGTGGGEEPGGGGRPSSGGGEEPGGGRAGGEVPGGDVVVATTRPELLPACVALVAHPSDARYTALIGTAVRTPLFGVEVPVLAHRLADPAKGTGIAMVCTFGDSNDVTWWRDLNLPLRPVLGRDGRLVACPPSAITSRAGRAAYRRLAGETARQARRRVTAMLREAGRLAGDPEPVKHPVNFYERGSQPLEIVTSRQWYLRNGAHDPALRDALLKRGREITWHPPHMRARLENWANGLTGDWLVSRQRFFGVPIPVWYPLDADGKPRYDAPITPGDAALPVDPAAQPPPGYREDQRGRPGGFTPDPDVMDTWATSSLTPQIAARWTVDGDLAGRVLPMDMRPQAHEIIRTWLFYTLLRSHTEQGELPWRHAAVSGWVLDPDRKKMSKSVGNVITPMESLRRHGSDAVRYWAASGRLGADLTFDPGQLRVGRRLAVKILNASRFVLGLAPPDSAPADPAGQAPAVSEPLDAALLARLAGVIARCTRSFEGFDHAGALAAAEGFFWFFCGDYLELVKARAYGERGEAPAASARAALRLALSVVLRLFAPFLPFVTEEVWSWWQAGSVHRAAWPEPAELGAALPGSIAGGTPGTNSGDGPGTMSRPGPGVLEVASGAIAAIRGAKSGARLSMRAPVRTLVVTGRREHLDTLRTVLADLAAAGRVGHTELRERDLPEPDYRVTL